MEDDRLGDRAAIHHRSYRFSLACFASDLTLAERRCAGTAQCVEERLRVLAWTTRCESRRVGLGWFYSRLSSAAGGDLLRGVHRDALSLARVADLRATLRAALSPRDEDQWRRITLECCEHFCRHRIGARDPALSRTDDAFGVAINIDYGHGHGRIEYARRVRCISCGRFSGDRRTLDIGVNSRDSCLRRCVQTNCSR